MPIPQFDGRFSEFKTQEAPGYMELWGRTISIFGKRSGGINTAVIRENTIVSMASAGSGGNHSLGA